MTEEIARFIQKAEHGLIIEPVGIALDRKSRDEHVLPLWDGLRQFKERAEL
jgi:hypothetical protein